MSVTYEILQKQAKQREIAVRKWQDELFSEAVNFASALKEELAPPDEVFSLTIGAERWLPFQLSEPESIRQNNLSLYRPLANPGFERFISNKALRFAIVLNFKNNLIIDTSGFHCLVRFEDRAPRFAFSRDFEESLDWYSMENAITVFLSQTFDAMSRDPYSSSEKKPIGFITH